jgi:hypothetical protein
MAGSDGPRITPGAHGLRARRQKLFWEAVEAAPPGSAKSLKGLARLTGVDLATLRDWRRDDPKFEVEISRLINPGMAAQASSPELLFEGFVRAFERCRNRVEAAQEVGTTWRAMDEHIAAHPKHQAEWAAVWAEYNVWLEDDMRKDPRKRQFVMAAEMPEKYGPTAKRRAVKPPKAERQAQLESEWDRRSGTTDDQEDSDALDSSVPS